jgi:hypothetical protein
LAALNCTRDEGNPFEFGNQALISSHRKLLRIYGSVSGFVVSSGVPHSSSVDGRVAGPALNAVDEKPVHLIVLGVHQNRPAVAA